MHKYWAVAAQDTVIEEDKEFVAGYFDMESDDMSRASPWVPTSFST